MREFKKYLISAHATVRTALRQLNELAADAVLFVIDERCRLLGSLTDGDLRRGFLRGLSFDDLLEEFIQSDPQFIVENNYKLDHIKLLRDKNFKVVPILNKNQEIIDILNFRYTRTLLPIDVVIMAGGEGKRLMPLTASIPKPLLPVGDKPILQHNIDRLKKYGIKKIHISVKYLGEKIIDYLDNGPCENLQIEYIREKEPLGTIGSISMIKEFMHDVILVMNSDLLTDIDFEDFYKEFIMQNATMGIASVPYYVEVPYAVFETNGDGRISRFKEKPTYTYFSNGGMYLIKKEALDYIPRNEFFNATDLIDKVINNGGNVYSYRLLGYWLDIGRHEDYKKAQEDIKHIEL